MPVPVGFWEKTLVQLTGTRDEVRTVAEAALQYLYGIREALGNYPWANVKQAVVNGVWQVATILVESAEAIQNGARWRLLYTSRNSSSLQQEARMSNHED